VLPPSQHIPEDIDIPILASESTSNCKERHIEHGFTHRSYSPYLDEEWASIVCRATSHLSVASQVAPRVAWRQLLPQDLAERG